MHDVLPIQFVQHKAEHEVGAQLFVVVLIGAFVRFCCSAAVVQLFCSSSTNHSTSHKLRPLPLSWYCGLACIQQPNFCDEPFVVSCSPLLHPVPFSASTAVVSMEADIPAANVRVFARALHTLSKIGEVLIVETAPDRLLIRALSPAQSSYAQISFAPSFFTHYSVSPLAASADSSLAGRSPLVDVDDTADLSYRTRPPSVFSTTASYPSPSPSSSSLPAPRAHSKVIVNGKACLTPFRGAVSTIKRLTIKLTSEEDCGYSELSTLHTNGLHYLPQQQHSSQRGKRKRGREGGGGGEAEGSRRGAGGAELEKDTCLMVQLHLDDVGVTKTYRIPTSEQVSVLQPDFSRQSCPTVLSAKAGKFQNWLTNFQNESATYTQAPLHSHNSALCCPLTSWFLSSVFVSAVWRS